MNAYPTNRKLDVACPGDGVWTWLRRTHGQQRLGYNLGWEASNQGDNLPALRKSPSHPDGLYGRLTSPHGSFAQDPRLDKGGTPVRFHRAGVSAARAAAKAQKEHREKVAWKVWLDLCDERECMAWLAEKPVEEQEALRDIWEDEDHKWAWLKEREKELRGPSIVALRDRGW